MKKALIVLIHFLTSFAIGDAIVVYFAFFYDYSAADFVKAFVVGCALIGFDYFACKLLLQKNASPVKKPKLLHGADLILSVPPGLFMIYGGLLDILAELTKWTDDLTNEMIRITGVLLIEALLILSRMNLMKQTHRAA